MAAIHEVRDLLAAKVAALTYDGSTITVLTDRDQSTPAKPADCPAVMIEENGAEITRIEGQAGGTMTHGGAFTITCLERATETQTSRERAYGVMSVVINALLDDFTLGGKVQEIRPTGYGGEFFGGQDVEGVPVDLQIDFCTANTDFDTLI